jgi:hypothetical protein
VVTISELPGGREQCGQGLGGWNRAERQGGLKRVEREGGQPSRGSVGRHAGLGTDKYNRSFGRGEAGGHEGGREAGPQMLG